MAVVSIEEKIAGIQATVEYSNLGRSATYTRTFMVQTDSPFDGPYSVMQAVSLQENITPGSPYQNANASETDEGAVFHRARAVPDEASEDGREWIVTLEYGPAGQGPVIDNPLLMAPQVDIAGRELSVPVTHDISGNLIRNSAGDPFDPPLMREEDRVIVTVSRNEATQAYADQFFIDTGFVYSGPIYNFNAVRNLANRVNSGTFLGYGPHKVKSLRPRVRRLFHPSVGVYFNVTYYFEIKDEEYATGDPPTVIGQGWDRVVLDAGYRFLKEIDDNEYELHIATVDGQPVQEPILLNGAGEVNSEGADPVYIRYEVYSEADFSSLGLPV